MTHNLKNKLRPNKKKEYISTQIIKVMENKRVKLIMNIVMENLELKEYERKNLIIELTKSMLNGYEYDRYDK